MKVVFHKHLSAFLVGHGALQKLHGGAPAPRATPERLRRTAQLLLMHE